MKNFNSFWAILFVAILLTSLYVLINRRNSSPPIQSNEKQSPIIYDSSTISLSNENWEDSILTFKSEFYDIEQNGDIVETIRKTSFHIFDFHKQIITQKIQYNGNWIIKQFAMNGFYKQTGLVASTYVFTINSDGMKEIWFCPSVPNLGYDYSDGSRIACYEIIQIP